MIIMLLEISLDKQIIIGIAGNIGVGKTTMTEKLSESLNFNPIYESVIDNPYLEDFYDNMPRWSFNLQVYFLYHRFQSQIDLIKTGKNFIQDRTIYEDREIFAKNLYDSGSMKGRDWETYKQLYSSMIQFINEPNLIVYLKANTDTLMSRINNRNRDFEKDISSEYIYSLNIYYDRWINSLDQKKVMIIDTNAFNIFKDIDKLESIINSIKERVEQK